MTNGFEANESEVGSDESHERWEITMPVLESLLCLYPFALCLGKHCANLGWYFCSGEIGYCTCTTRINSFGC